MLHLVSTMYLLIVFHQYQSRLWKTCFKSQFKRTETQAAERIDVQNAGKRSYHTHTHTGNTQQFSRFNHKSNYKSVVLVNLYGHANCLDKHHHLKNK